MDKKRIKQIVMRRMKQAVAAKEGFDIEKRDQTALESFPDLKKYADKIVEIYSNGVTPEAAKESGGITLEAVEYSGKIMSSFDKTSDGHDIFESLYITFQLFRKYLGEYNTNPSKYQNLMERAVSNGVQLVQSNVESAEKEYIQFLEWQDKQNRESDGEENTEKTFLFRGKAMSLKAVKSQMTQEIISAFNEYGQMELPYANMVHKKGKIADEVGALYDAVSVNPNTGEVEIEITPFLPTAHIQGTPIDPDDPIEVQKKDKKGNPVFDKNGEPVMVAVEGDEAYDGIPISEWDDEEAIQKWIDQFLGGLVIVKKVESSPDSNIVTGVWNGAIPVGMTIGKGKSLNAKGIANILKAKTLKALNRRIKANTFISKEDVQDAINKLIDFSRQNPHEFNTDKSFFEELHTKLVDSMNALIPTTAGRETELDYGLRLEMLELVYQVEDIINALKMWDEDDVNPESGKVGNVKDLAVIMFKKLRRLLSTENFIFRQENPTEVFPK